MPRRSRHTGVTRVYRYGCPHWAEFDDAAMGQLRLAHDLRNKLVEIEHAHAEAVRKVWEQCPGVAAATARAEQAQECVAALRAQAKAERVHDRTTAARRGTAAELRSARQELKDAKAALRAAKDAAFADGDLFTAASDERREAIKATYAEFSQERGLYWATYNDVAAHHETALARMKQARQEGRKAELRFHRWTGEGTLAVQLQHQAGDPARTPALIASGQGKWRNVATLTPWIDPAAWEAMPRPERQRLRLGELRARTGRDAHLVLPVIVHRPVPGDAEISDVRITRRTVAGQSRISVAVTCLLPAPAPPVDGATTAVRLSWAAAGEGWLRSARIASSRPLPPVPADLEPLVRVSPGGMAAEMHFSPGWRALLERDAGIRSYRDQMTDDLRAEVTAALEADPLLAESLEVTPAQVARWRAPRRFVHLCSIWPRDHALAEGLEAWRKRDRHLWAFECHERDQVIARRRDAYRKLAAWLCGCSRQVVLHGLDLASLKRIPCVGAEDTEQARHGRAQLQVAAPGELRGAIEAAASRLGVEVVYATERYQEGEAA